MSALLGHRQLSDLDFDDLDPRFGSEPLRLRLRVDEPAEPERRARFTFPSSIVCREPFLFLLLELSVGLEAVQVAAHRALCEPHPAAGLVDQVRRLDVERESTRVSFSAELVEGDDPGVGVALGDVPLDPLVGALLDDLGLEALADPPDLRLEGDRGLVDRARRSRSGA